MNETPAVRAVNGIGGASIFHYLRIAISKDICLTEARRVIVHQTEYISCWSEIDRFRVLFDFK